jgi:hypothetical protein
MNEGSQLIVMAGISAIGFGIVIGFRGGFGGFWDTAFVTYGRGAIPLAAVLVVAGLLLIVAGIRGGGRTPKK